MSGPWARRDGTGLKQWFIVHTYSGFEAKVKESLRQRADAMGMGGAIEDILIPTEEVVEVRDGRRCAPRASSSPATSW
jgi:transcription antitermination factor NusG